MANRITGFSFLSSPVFDSGSIATYKQLDRLVKAIVNPADARKVIDLGADGIVVSSRGGRQLDRVVNTLQVLEAVRAEVDPEVEIIYDSGVMSGVDIAIALALGADFVLIGRAYLYGLMAGGKEGVDRVIKLLASELKNTL